MGHRIVIVSTDASFVAAQMAWLECLADVTVDVCPPNHPDHGGAALWLVDVANGPVPDVPGPVVAIAPRAEMTTWLDVLTGSSSVVAVLAAGTVPAPELRALATRLIDAAPVGLHELLADGAEQYQCTIADRHDLQRCVREVIAIAERLKLPGRTRTVLEQCIDELVMNALYDAPVDSTGHPVFAGVPSATRVTLRTDATVQLRCGWDPHTFVVAVRDEFGALSRATILSHLAKGARMSDPAGRRVGGAGLGLYLTVSSANVAWFEVTPGQSTDVLCAFDREEIRDVPGCLGARFHTAPSTAPRTTRSRHALSRRARGARWLATHRWITLGVVVALAIAAISPRVIRQFSTPALEVTTSPAGARVELAGRRTQTTDAGPARFDALERGQTYSVRAHAPGHRATEASFEAGPGDQTLHLELLPAAVVELTSTPEGAAVQIDGRRVGWTPVVVDDLAPNSSVIAGFALDGYRKATATIQVPSVGQRTRVVEKLVLGDNLVSVHFESTPQGAAIVRTGARPSSDRTYTPADLLVEAGKQHQFSFEMLGRKTVVLPPFTASREGLPTSVQATLPER